uniref:Dynactin subunit 3 n=2 Tax=Schistocephalus solidus TaxID=70667 RepID=A0A0V0J370_SCHSO
MSVASLEARVAELERIILGGSQIALPELPPRSIFQQLSDAHKALLAAERRNKIKETLDRTNEIRKYLDPHFLDDVAMSNEAKIKVILAQESTIVETARALESLDALKGFLNQPACSDLQDLKAKFAKLTLKHAEQQTLTADLIDETNELLQEYADTIRDISKLFVAWHNST